jgi:hypothetical protein
MKNSLLRAALTLSGLMFIVIVIGNVVIVAQEVVTGTWTANTRTDKNDREDAGKIHLSFERRTDRGGRNQNGSSFEYSDLQGLSRETAMGDGRANFKLIREAGTIECEGTFINGRGTGTFRFTPDMSFVSTMRSKGFDFEKDSGRHIKRNKNDDDDNDNDDDRDHDTLSDRLLTAAFLNVRSSLADDLNSANFGKLYVEDLYKAAIFKIDGKFMSEMKATGFPNMQMEDLVKARIFKIDADYVRQIHEMGFDNRDFEQLVKFRIFKVTPQFLNELKAAGLQDLEAEDIVKCRIFKIDPEFVRTTRAKYPNATVEDMVKMKIGVFRWDKDKDWN